MVKNVLINDFREICLKLIAVGHWVKGYFEKAGSWSVWRLPPKYSCKLITFTGLSGKILSPFFRIDSWEQSLVRVTAVNNFVYYVLVLLYVKISISVSVKFMRTVFIYHQDQAESSHKFEELKQITVL